ncbi:hypothetical protein CP965_07285 [Halarcobacter mediterraneus]|uniref:4-alpha-L-fucosyltransferase n=1 Tax=Halarcobacter mediterraneus TaxID=2023153 RepID=A0A4Q1AUY9_9BACT|nr:TDP-N-acetylfucosamine:lipid II N-acetylfucosaminyltransferase [Halarcobacter mediterraneus]RXK13593.1 hypothetical protein CP965_07285 [Halarcobacter mediterraneus]
MILHIMIMDKFLPSFINFTDKHFGRENHKYVFITSEKYNYGLNKKHEVEFLHTNEEIFHTLLEYMKNSEKIILHGLWRDKVDLLLIKNPHLLSKSYWIMWGGDFYFPKKHSDNRKKIIKNIPYLVTGTTGEIEYVRKHYNAKGKHIKAFVYTSNLFKDIKLNSINTDTIRILVGNSSTETNQHFQVFEKLKKYKHKNIQIYVPLSYGNPSYGMKVMKKGYELFKDKFNPMIDFMNEKNYYEFLSTINIAIFNHNRQQGMGNIITLLGMGKKVYMNPKVSTYKMFLENSIKVFNIDNIDLELINNNQKNNNIKNTKFLFSKESFIQQLKEIFN